MVEFLQLDKYIKEGRYTKEDKKKKRELENKRRTERGRETLEEGKDEMHEKFTDELKRKHQKLVPLVAENQVGPYKNFNEG